MELLLNLIWICGALAAFYAFARFRRNRRTSWVQATIALTCMIVLLFPIVSATDDLHPVGAVLDDARRLEQGVAVAHASQGGPAADMVPLLLALYLLFLLTVLQRFRPETVVLQPQQRARRPHVGRAPPFAA